MLGGQWKKTNSRPTEILKLGYLAGGKIDLEGGKWKILFWHVESHLQEVIGENKGLDEITKGECWD